jgi:hypothetical protein
MLDRTIRSMFNQSYPFIELFLIYPEQNRVLGQLAREFRNLRSHIPVRLIETAFPIESEHDCVRALERAQSSLRGRWLVILESNLTLDRFAIETGLELAGSNEISALTLRPGFRCRTLREKLIAPARQHFVHAMRTVRRGGDAGKRKEPDSSFLLVNREAFDAVNRINRMPGILNEAGWDILSYQVEGLRTFDADGSRWVWQDVHSQDVHVPAGFVIGSTVLAVIAMSGPVYSLTQGVDSFGRVAILAFSGISYLLMAAGYCLSARKFHGAVWAAPIWFIPHVAAAVLAAFHPLERPLGNSGVTQVVEIVKDGNARHDPNRR